MKNIIIITGKINSGKTTFLQNQIQLRNDVQGILTPKINGKRVFMNIKTREIFEMEDEIKKENSIFIGNYFFNQESFDKAINIIQLSIESNYLIFDEIGPLELQGKGFYSTLIQALNKIKNSQKLILVIRESILETVINKLNIQNKILKIINIENNITSPQSIFS